MNKNYYTGPSEIHGDGLFASVDFKKGGMVGLAHVNGQPVTEIGKLHNHDEENPTMVSKKIGNKRYVYANQDLKAGTELTTNYRMQPELGQPEEFDVPKAQDGIFLSSGKLRPQTNTIGTGLGFTKVFPKRDTTWSLTGNVGYAHNFDADKSGLAASINAENFGKFFGGQRRVNAVTNLEAYKEPGNFGAQVAAGPNLHWGSHPKRSLPRGTGRLDFQPFNLRVGYQSTPYQTDSGDALFNNTTGRISWGYGAKLKGEYKPKLKGKFRPTLFGDLGVDADFLMQDYDQAKIDAGSITSSNEGFKIKPSFSANLGIRVPIDGSKLRRRRRPDPIEEDDAYYNPGIRTSDPHGVEAYEEPDNYQKGGFILNLNEQEAQRYAEGGYILEELAGGGEDCPDGTIKSRSGKCILPHMIDNQQHAVTSVFDPEYEEYKYRANTIYKLRKELQKEKEYWKDKLLSEKDRESLGPLFFKKYKERYGEYPPGYLSMQDREDIFSDRTGVQAVARNIYDYGKDLDYEVPYKMHRFANVERHGEPLDSNIVLPDKNTKADIVDRSRLKIPSNYILDIPNLPWSEDKEKETEYRKWVVENYPDVAKQYDLDPFSPKKLNNRLVRSFWQKYPMPDELQTEEPPTLPIHAQEEAIAEVKEEAIADELETVVKEDLPLIPLPVAEEEVIEQPLPSAEEFYADSLPVTNSEGEIVLPYEETTGKSRRERRGTRRPDTKDRSWDGIKGNLQRIFTDKEYSGAWFPNKKIKQEGGPIVKQRKGVRENFDHSVWTPSGEFSKPSSVSSHLMAAEEVPGRGWVGFPTLFQGNPYVENESMLSTNVGEWLDMSNQNNGWWPIYEEADRRGEVYDFGEDKEAAIAFGEGSWKDQLPDEGMEAELSDEEVERYRAGGYIVEEI